MAEEAILQVSLRDYKKSIDDLRASLLSLEEGSEEYAATAEEIRQRQDKLNEVMSVGKKEVDGVAGSYNALSQEMSRLKKEWKNLEIGSEQWVAMGQQIDAINDKLKSADASVGVFSRNVGDYENAFASAFEKSVDALGKVDGPLGGVMQTVKQLIPVIKNANSTAVKGLSGVKKAIVSTGVGALVVAVGLLVANWDKLAKIFRKGSKDTEKLIESNDTLNKSFDEQNRQLENEIIVMQADGASADEVNAKKQALIATQIAETRATIEETKAKIAQIGKHSLLGRILRGEQGEFKKLQETLENLTATETGLVQQEEKINANAYADRVKNRRNAANKEIEEVKRILEEVEKASKTELQELDEKYKKEYALLKKHHKDTSKLTEQYEKDRTKLIREAEKARKEALDAQYSSYVQSTADINPLFTYQYAIEEAKEKFLEFSKIFEKATGEKRIPNGLLNYIINGGNAEGFSDKVKHFFDETSDDIKQLLAEAKDKGLIATEDAKEFSIAWINSLNTVKKAIRDYYSALEDPSTAGKAMPTVELKSGDRIRNELEESLYYLQNVREVYEGAAKGAIGEFEKIVGVSFNDFFNNYTANLSEVVDRVNKFWENKEPKNIEEKTAYQEILYFFEKYNDAINESNKLNEERISRLQELNNLEAENAVIVAETNRDISGFNNTTDFSDIWEQRINAAKQYYESTKELIYDSEEERVNAVLAAEKNLYDIQREYNQKMLDNHIEFANQVANVYGSIADILDESINHQKQNLIEQGKTEEEANELLKGKFKFVQAFQISQAVINTISGALAAFTTSQELGQPWGMAIGIAQAAAVTAAGVAQIQKIANTKLGSGAGNVSSISANSTPKLMDYEPQKTQNITGASDEEKLQKVIESTNIWVSVKDINSVQSGVKARVSESSF